MIILSIYGEIEPITLSDKLGLFVSNLTDSSCEDWLEDLEGELATAKLVDDFEREKLGIPPIETYGVSSDGPSMVAAGWTHEVGRRLIYMGMSYEYEDMPLGDYETNCFDGRLCEEDYVEKILDFMGFAAPHGGRDEQHALLYSVLDLFVEL
ncbi:MAG: hypothetical protein K6F70_07570 [Eggerthellaceae bacterium]|nr:hypothetical protein [Eggerthellaceae bacterium]